MTENKFHGQQTHQLQNKYLSLEYLSNTLRITSLKPSGKQNLFADMGDSSVNTPYGAYNFLGGHRFWHAPEAMPRTYIPDDGIAAMSEIPGGVRIDQAAQEWNNIAKSIEIRLNPERPQVFLHHELRNDGAWPIQAAPWAITMMRHGGIGIFPQAQGNVDDAGLLPNRNLSLWPYTRISDPRLILRDDCILLRGKAALPPLKIGYYNPAGWQGYWIEGLLFVKRFESKPGLSYPDNGCNAETYCGDLCIELESLGALTELHPGQTAAHDETWEIYDSIDQPFIPSEIVEFLSR